MTGLWEERKILKIRKTSPSILNRWDTCPFQWKCNWEKRPGIEIDPTPRDLGNNVHSMIDVYHKMISPKPKASEIKAVANTVFESKFNPSLSHVKKDVKRCIQNFIAFEIMRLKTWKVYKPTFTEKRLENDRYLCIVDFHSDDQGVSIDWKTGKLDRLWNSHLRQGKINQIVLGDNGHNSKRFLFVGLKTGHILEMPLVATNWVDQQREKMLRMIERGEFPKKKGPLCDKFCPYVLDCEFAEVCLWMP